MLFPTELGRIIWNSSEHELRSDFKENFHMEKKSEEVLASNRCIEG